MTRTTVKRRVSLPAAMRRRAAARSAAQLPIASQRPAPAWRTAHYDGPTSEAGRIEWAKYLATGIVPPLYRGNPGACLSLILKAQALDVPLDTAKENVYWNVSTGKGSISAQLMAALLRRHHYHVKVLVETDKQVVMQFSHLVNGRLRKLGTAEWTMLEAIGAGLAWRDLWRHYPTDMLWARCLMRGARRYASDVGTGLAYTPEEINDMGDPADGSEVHAAVTDILTRATTPGVNADHIRDVLVKEAKAKKLLGLDTGDGTDLGFVLAMLYGERRAAETDATAARPPAPVVPVPPDAPGCGCDAEVLLLTGEHQPEVCRDRT